ncbi:protein phosphatase 2C domain-containing protein [Streptomyces sp. NBC_01288]|uniref:protein phosphatase 2C domain-containing protein n=1 Tax=Streptomyces sp. NBC_01288 TaxID=2903814 RepID=UPI003FA3D2F9|nr:protein phosphatase 2C domain-containing protein [Streptomyces sp. NBC_01288]
MSQQGGTPTGHEDDWWSQLYDDTAEDTGPTAAGDSVDDRFASAAGTVGVPPADEREGSVGVPPAGEGARPVGVPSADEGARSVRVPSADEGAPPVGMSSAGEGARSVGPGVPGPRAGGEPGSEPPAGTGFVSPGASWEPSAGAPPVPGGGVGADVYGEPPLFRPVAPAAPGDGASPSAVPGDAGADSYAEPPLFRPVAPAAPGEQAPPVSPRQGLHGDTQPDLPSAAPQRAADEEFPPVRPQPAVPAPPADSPAAAPEDLRPDGLSAPQPTALPVRPTVSPASASRDSRPEVPGSYAQSSAVPVPPTDSPAVAPKDPRPEGPGPYPPPPVAPAAAPQPLRPERPFDPRPYPQPPAAAPPLADNSRPYPHTPGAPQPLPLAPPPNLPALAPPPPTPLTVDYVGSGPPTYDAEPTALPLADPDELDDLVADTVLDGARYGASTIRAASVRGDSARFRGEPRRDSLLTARFGVGEQALVLVAMATGARATPGAHRAAAEACDWIARAVGRSHARLSEDIRAARRGDLKSGLHRLTDRSLGKLRASAAEQGIDPEEYSAGLRCLLLPAQPECRTRVFFGVGPGGLFRLRDGEWQDIEPTVGDLSGEAVVGFGSQPAETPEGDRLTMDLGIPTPPSPYEPAPEPPREPFRFRASVARPGDTLLMCTGGLAEPLRGEPELSAHLAGRWSGSTPPGLAAFLADTQVRVKGYADDRTAAAVWEA